MPLSSKLDLFAASRPLQWAKHVWLRYGFGLELLALIIVLVPLFVRRTQFVQFHVDENYWIASSYFLEAFVSGDFSAETWSVNYWTEDQTPLARYVVGAGRRLGGYGVADLVPKWDFSVDGETNVAEGRMPNPELLWWSRLPMAILSALSLVVWFWVIAQLFGRLAAYIFITLGVLSIYIAAMTLRATPEALLLFSIAITAAAGLWAVRYWQRGVKSNSESAKAFLPTIAGFGLMGIGCGIAGSAKLNGLAALAAGIVVCLLLLVVRQGNSTARVRWLVSILASTTILATTLITFVVLNPYLYRAPITRTMRIVQMRFDHLDLEVLTRKYPDSVIASPADRLRLVPEALFRNYAPARFNGVEYLYIPSVIGGIASLVLRIRHLSGGDESSAACLFLLGFFIVVSLPPLASPLNWDRYFLLPEVFCMVLASLGLAAALAEVPKLLHLTRLRRLAARVAAHIRIA